MTGTYAAAFLTALGVSLLATPVARRIALRLGLVDRPDERKIHGDPTPYLGGVAIIVGFTLAVAGGAYLQGFRGAYSQAAAILGGGVVLAAIGLWDDLRDLPGWVKVPVEVLLAIGLYLAGSRAQLFGVPALDLAITVAWVVGVTNAMNYMDNMDGLTAGVAAIAAAYFFSLAALSGQILVAGLSVALAGCALGFLWHNRPPARIFMGDAGSLFLGFLLAGLGLELRFEGIARVTFFVPVAVLAVPILDALMVSISRTRRGVSPIMPGRDHISHRLVKVGIPPAAAVGLLYLAALACGWIGVVIAYAQPLTAYMLMGWLAAVGMLLGGLLLKVEA